MDKLEQYSNAIKKILTEYYEMTTTQAIAAEESEVSVVDDLLSEGIPQSDIIFSFHHPSKPALIKFAIA